ncbi:MAG: molybdenum cofactor guanylyltransferase [Candidatus Omnitrophica bacterium]|nr:molybdenum cofactor guanylyltransferase [Candidatus Omnitrophota bacterium]
MQLSAVILAGGKNSRMKGKDKAFMLVKGKPLVERTISLLRKNFPEIVVVTNSPGRYKKYPVAVVRDAIPGLGPLGGIYSGLRSIKNEAAFFVACDMPFLHNAIIEKQIARFKKTKPPCLVARCRDLEPLHAVYTKTMLPLMRRMIVSGDFSLKNFIAHCPGAAFCDFPGSQSRYFSNLNTLQNFAKAKCLR